VVALDPLRDPVIDRVGHEAGHLAGMAWFGHSANLAQFALRWADHGHFGAFDGVRRTTGDPKREPRDRSTIAALGPVFGGTALDDPSAAADRRSIDLNVTDGWNLETWRWLAAKRARELARTEAFRTLWKHFVLALADLGELVELRGDDLDRFRATVPDAEPPSHRTYHRGHESRLGVHCASNRSHPIWRRWRV
jgi:hypothetical protein